MQQDFATGSGVHEMLGEALDAVPTLAAPLREAVRPLSDQRIRLREALGDLGALQPLPDEEGNYLSVAAVDGASAISQLFIGDQINVLALAIQSDLRSGAVAIQGHRSINQFLPHSPGNNTYAKAAMFGAELELLTTVSGEDVVTVVDGSHSTAATAINEALTFEGSPAYDYICDELISDQLIAAFDALAGREDIVACPKSDSSTEISEFIEAQGIHLPLRFPDKVLASLVLEQGEVLTLSQCDAPWMQYDITADHVTSSQGRAIRDRIAQACAGLRDGLRVAHVKPHGSATAIRIETKASINDFDTCDYWQAVAEDCEPPHTQEPVAQYIADHLAKNVTEVAKVQLDTARLDLAESADDGLLEFLIRTHRTT